MEKFEQKKAFIGLCIAMAGSDQRIDMREIAKLKEVMVRYGFSDDEVVRELEDFSKMNIEEALIYGRRCVKALSYLDDDMRDNLLISLSEIAMADSIYHENQLKMFEIVKRRLNWKEEDRFLDETD